MPSDSVFDLFTIGHSNVPIAHFLGQLRANGVEQIADVRSQPFSRRFPWFSRDALSASLASEGIGYAHFGDSLGGRPSDPALFCDGVVDYEALARTDSFRAGLDAAMTTARERRLCLMCAEREPLDCHRCLLVARALAERGVRVGHIRKDASVEPHAATEERLIAMMKVGDDLFSAGRADNLAEAYRRRARAFAFRG